MKKAMGRNLPPSIPEEKIEGIYRQELYRLSNSVIEKIHEFIKTIPEASATSAEFQVFPDEYCEGASAIWMYFGGIQDEKVEDEDPRLIAGKSVNFYSDFSSLPTLDLHAYKDLEFPHMLADLIIQWFAECWWKAGGWYYPIPVQIHAHDGFGQIGGIHLTNK